MSPLAATRNFSPSVIILRFGILAVIAVAITLRIWGVDWDRGFYWTPHPDERAILSIVEQLSLPPLSDASSFLNAEESPWNPRWFPYGSFPLYLLKSVDMGYSLIFGEHSANLRILGRLISAAADIATITMVFILGRQIYGKREALLASGLVSLAVIHIQLSHFFAVDTLLALFTITAIYYMLRISKTGALKYSVMAGLFMGLGLATKTSLAPIFGPFLVSHFMYAFSLSDNTNDHISFSRRWSSAIKGLSLGIITSVLVLLIAQPYMFLDWGRFYGDVVEQSEMVLRIRDYPYTRQYIDTSPYLYQIRQLTTWGLGWPLGIISWLGLLYVSLRGMRPRFGFYYVTLGWLLPIAILLSFGNFMSILVSGIISTTALLATLLVRTKESRSGVLLLAWVIPTFLIAGSFEVKFLRYLLPITPFLILFGAKLFFSTWDKVNHVGARTWLWIGMVVVIVSTGLYAISYSSIYRGSHTAVRASEWINHNAPTGSVILKEHWEESLPGLQSYKTRELPMYNDDLPGKTRLLAEELSKGDYLILYSNRLYGTIPRIPERYPMTTAYYQQLFSGNLGYELVNYQTTYPQLFNVALVNDTFSRPGIKEPHILRANKPAAISINLGFADESFSVYDHPKILVLANVKHYDAETIQQSIETMSLGIYPSSQMTNNHEVGLLLSEKDAWEQQNGGTWTDIVKENSWINRVPALIWLILLEGLSLIVLPINFFIFRPLSDRGYLFAKTIALLSIGLIIWLFASLHWMAFSRASILVACIAIGVVSALISFTKRAELIRFVKQKWPIIAVGEVVFLIAFFSFVLLRMANPDLWHPWRGGEKPMDLAYLNAVLRSSYMPPYDPWFSGGYLNYYYWGQFLVSIFIKALGIPPTTAYNLAVPMFFALVVSGSFSIVYNLTEGTLSALRKRNDIPRDGYDAKLSIRNRLSWISIMAGVTASLFVAVLGNLDGAIQLGLGIYRATFNQLPFGVFDFWKSSRMMPSDLQGITEFPFFTFLFADLHAHMMALPFTLVIVGIALAIIISATNSKTSNQTWKWESFLRFVFLGIAIGSLRLINAWDFPTYLLLGISAIFLAEFLAHGGFSGSMLVKGIVKSISVFLIGYIVFLPFHLNYQTFFNSLEATTNTTVLWRFLGIHGLFIFIIGSFFFRESWNLLKSRWDSVRKSILDVSIIASSNDANLPDNNRVIPGMRTVIILLAMMLGLGYILTAIFSGIAGFSIPFVSALLTLVLVVNARWLFSWKADTPYLIFVSIPVVISLALVIGLDVFRVEGDIDRMNSVFKFYLQVWVLLALASAYLLWRLLYNPFKRSRRWRTKIWCLGLATLLISASIYPVLGTRARLADRFYGNSGPFTLDGTAFLTDMVYQDLEGEIDLEADFEGIRWLQENVQGSPVILEGNTPTYRWGSRVSVYTGLPTIIGWKWHQEQQRWGYRSLVEHRIQDVNRLYKTKDMKEAFSLLSTYNVRYVYIGQLERLYYTSEGLDKFERMVGSGLEKVFQTQHVTIYRVIFDEHNST